jgi:hypothetical protein
MKQVRPVMRVMQPEKLLNCTNTLTNFMRSGDSENTYKYWLIKGLDTSQTEYASNWYNIYRTDGEYYIHVKDEHGCMSITSLPVLLCEERIYDAPPKIEDPPNAVQKIVAKNIIIFPNPAREYIFIESDKDVFMELFDTKGIKLKHTTENYLKISDLANGVYFVKLISDNNISIQKIIVIKE